ncbi:stealth family protein [Microbacterium soli]|uniref:Stealth family protein n=1 Tax=Microbacterium soli TaxID=446075 RepID=A0ABP7MUS9_9MICO
MSADPIDFVVTWVNSDDLEWRARRDSARRKHGLSVSGGGAGEERHREWGLFRYWFRSIEKHCPWVRRIYLVHAGRLPEWLDVSHPRLSVVSDQELLGDDVQTFNSHAVESQLLRLEGLSEKFVYFNDDFYIGRPLRPDFFFPGGLPYGVNVPTILADGDDRAHAMLNASGLINRHFSRREYWSHVVRRTLRPASGAMLARAPLFLASSVIPPVTDPHVGMPFLRTVVEEAFAAEPEAIAAASRAVFRSPLDVAPLYYASMWHFARGAYTARSKKTLGRYFSLSGDLAPIIAAIESEKYAQFCLNDAAIDDLDVREATLARAFQARFPEVSDYEYA